ncbi:hypothetical protein SGCZBJ_11265, partial [Caulobacter zeae]
RDAFLFNFVELYNQTRLLCLDHKAPAELLAKLSGHNTFAGMVRVGCGEDRSGSLGYHQPWPMVSPSISMLN